MAPFSLVFAQRGTAVKLLGSAESGQWEQTSDALLELVKGISAFASYSESFLANTTMLRVNNVPAIPAAPAVGRGWEMGTKLEVLEGLLSGSISAY